MWRDLVFRSVHLMGSLVAAVILAALLMTLSLRAHGFAPFLSAFSMKLVGILKGDFGVSAARGVPAVALVMLALPATLKLIGLGAVVALALGAPLGTAFGASLVAHTVAPLMELIAALPVFAAALAVLWIAAHLPQAAQGAERETLQTLMLQVAIVGVVGAGSVQLALRRGAARAWSAPYREGLRIMGLSSFDISLHYAAPEMAASLLRNLGQVIVGLISSAVVVEMVFARGGAAVLLLKSAMEADWNVAAAILLLIAAIVIVADFIGALAANAICPHEHGL
jgi:peptide/nickel transport system permease protein